MRKNRVLLVDCRKNLESLEKCVKNPTLIWTQILIRNRFLFESPVESLTILIVRIGSKQTIQFLNYFLCPAWIIQFYFHQKIPHIVCIPLKV